MAYLTQKNFRALLEFLRRLYEMRNFDNYVDFLLKELPGVVPADVITYNEMEPSAAQSKNWCSPAEVDTPEIDRAWERHMSQHPTLAVILKTGDGSARKVSDFLSVRQFHDTGLYADLYREWRCEDNLTCSLPSPRGIVYGIGLHRGRRTFTEQDRLLLNVARPHIFQARRNAKILTRMEEELRALRQTLENLKSGVAVLSSAGRVRSMTRCAREWLEEFFSDTPRAAGGLPETVGRWIRRQDGLPHEAVVKVPRTPLVAEREGRRLELRVISAAGEKLLVMENQPTSIQPTRLESRGLSKREAEVLAWVAQGKTNADVGTILGISRRTVQKHLERIFQRLGVESRTAAAAWALQSNQGLHPRLPSDVA